MTATTSTVFIRTHDSDELQEISGVYHAHEGTGPKGNRGVVIQYAPNPDPEAPTSAFMAGCEIAGFQDDIAREDEAFATGFCDFADRFNQ